MIAPRSSGARRVVVGGGIASGKTTVAREMERLGALVVVADEIGHDVLRPDGEAFTAVAEAWPEVIRNGSVDRAALAAIVFSDQEQLRRLEALTHPAIRARIGEIVAGAEGDVVVEVPVALDLPGRGWVKVFVDAPTEVRVRRAVDRGGDEGDVRRRMAAQPSRDGWLEWSDHVIRNDGTPGDLRARVVELWQEPAG